MAPWGEGDLRAALATRVICRDLRFHETIDSTSTEARRILSSGSAAHGTAVVAAHQLAGRGTGTNRWVSDAPVGVWCTVILTGETPSPVSLMIGCAVVDALRSFGVDAHLKWPNDVLIGRRKIAGILVETVSGSHLVGIGINVAQESFEGELADRATSLRMEVPGSHPTVPHVFGVVVGAIEQHLDDHTPIAHRWIARTRMIDTEAEIRRPSGSERVTVRGVMADGRLVVERADGHRAPIAAASDMDLVWPVGGIEGAGR